MFYNKFSLISQKFRNYSLVNVSFLVQLFSLRSVDEMHVPLHVPLRAIGRFFVKKPDCWMNDFPSIWHMGRKRKTWDTLENYFTWRKIHRYNVCIELDRYRIFLDFFFYLPADDFMNLGVSKLFPNTSYWWKIIVKLSRKLIDATSFEIAQ